LPRSVFAVEQIPVLELIETGGDGRFFPEENRVGG